MYLETFFHQPILILNGLDYTSHNPYIEILFRLTPPNSNNFPFFLNDHCKQNDHSSNVCD